MSWDESTVTVRRSSAEVKAAVKARVCTLCNGQGQVRSSEPDPPDPPDLPRPDCATHEPCWGCQLEAAELHYGLTGKRRAQKAAILPGAGPLIPVRPMGRDGRPVDDEAFMALQELGWCRLAPAEHPIHTQGEML